MDPMVGEVLNLALRWLHVLCGIAWLGYAYFLLVSWAPMSLKLETPTRKSVTPVLITQVMPFFRAVAVLTWLSGVGLLGLVYWAGGLMLSPNGGSGVAIGAGLGAMLLSFFVYDAVFKSPLGSMGNAGGMVCAALFLALAFGLSQVMPGRAMFIHLGATLGTMMLMNAAMRLAPAQTKFLQMLRDEIPFDPRVAALVAQRSTHNVVMSVAAVAFMLSFHAPSAYAHPTAWALAGAMGIVCFMAASALLGALVPPPPPPPPPGPVPAAKE